MKSAAETVDSSSLPRRTLFIRLIHNFNEPKRLSGDSGPWRTPPPYDSSHSGMVPLQQPSDWDVRGAAASQVPPGHRATDALPHTCGGGAVLLPSAAVFPHHHHHTHHEVVPASDGLLSSSSTAPVSSGSAWSPHRSYTTASGPHRPSDGPLQADHPSHLAPAYGHGAAPAMPQGPLQDGDLMVEENQRLFAIASSVLCEQFFSERFAGFVSYCGFLRPPYFGGCFVMFERDDDALSCLRWFRDNEAMKCLFFVQFSRNDSYVPRNGGSSC